MTTTSEALPGVAEATAHRAVLASLDWDDDRPLPTSALARVVPATALAASTLCLVVGAAELASNGLDALRVYLLAALALSIGALAYQVRHATGRWERDLVAIAGVSVVAGVVLLFTPEYTYGHEINGIIHRSLFSSLTLLALGLPAVCASMYCVLGRTPTAWDRSRYPLIVVPVALILVAYGAIIAHLLSEGVPDLSWHVMLTSYDVQLGDAAFTSEAGMRNHIIGTLLLVAMTAAIALPVGVGAGVCMSEYDGRLAHLIRVSSLVLRAISVFILGVTAFTLADWSAQFPAGDLRSDALRGFYYTDDGFKIPGHGSFVTAAVVLSLLVIPVIARATEEGLRSVPRDVREGSFALGATEGHGLLHILLPWAAPNIITGLLLGCAEASGSVAVLLFIAGTGEFGVGPLREASSLSYLVYYATPGRGPDAFTNVMAQYQFAAAVLLLGITFGLSIVALILKQRFGKRYRAGITAA